MAPQNKQGHLVRWQCFKVNGEFRRLASVDKSQPNPFTRSFPNKKKKKKKKKEGRLSLAYRENNRSYQGVFKSSSDYWKS